MNNIDKFDYEGISLHSKSWEESEKELRDGINNCNSVSKLKKLRELFEVTSEQVRLSKVFFRCESNVNHTKISLSLYDGTEFISFICVGCVKEVFPDEQKELLKCVLRIQESSIKRIDERLHTLEEFNKKQKTKDFITAIIIMILGIIFLLFRQNISEIIVRNISGIDLNIMKSAINFVLSLLLVFFMGNPAFIAMKWFIRENF